MFYRPLCVAGGARPSQAHWRALHSGEAHGATLSLRGKKPRPLSLVLPPLPLESAEAPARRKQAFR